VGEGGREILISPPFMQGACPGACPGVQGASALEAIAIAREMCRTKAMLEEGPVLVFVKRAIQWSEEKGMLTDQNSRLLPRLQR